MKTLVTVFLLIVGLILGSITPSFSQNPELWFQKGLIKEEGEGSLLEAIELYNKIVENKDSDKSLQAKALLHVGLCYEKLGRNEATKAYQSLINNFPGQKSEVAIARERLSNLDRSFLRKNEIVEGNIKTLTSQKVWTGPETDDSGSPSPDGRFLTYMDGETGNLAIRELSTGKTHLLTKEGTWEDPMQFTIGSTISPNNKQVAYCWYNLNNNYEIRLLDIDNPQPNVLYSNKNEDIYPCQWSKDGKILYARSYQNKTRHCRIIAITVSDGDIKVLKTFNFFYWMQLSVSPDNQFIAYDLPIDKDGGNFDIHLVSTDGKNESSLVEHPANDRILGWFPDKNQILIKSDRSGTWDAWIVSVLNGKVAGEPERVLTEIGQVTPMGFTDNGTYYYSIFSRKFTTFTVPFDIIKGKLNIELHKPLLGSIFNAEWSPDGMIILVLGYNKERKLQKDYEGGIYTIEVESGKVTELHAFYNSKDDAGVSLWARSAAEWSNDQKSIYYTTNGKLNNRELTTGKEKILVQKQEFNRTLDLSPNGENLLYCVGSQLNVIPTSGGKAKKLFSVSKANKIRNAVWSPRGNYIYFTENMNNINDGSVLWRISSEGKKPKKVWRSKGPISSLSIHPEEQKIVLSTFTQETEIWRLENLLSIDETVNK